MSVECYKVNVYWCAAWFSHFSVFLRYTSMPQISWNQKLAAINNASRIDAVIDVYPNLYA